MIRYYGMDGQPMSAEAWMTAFEDVQSRIIAKTKVPDGEVSTVWLGLDHGFGNGPPLIFESIVFGGPLSGEGQRYPTQEEARAGHAELVARCGGAVA